MEEYSDYLLKGIQLKSELLTIEGFDQFKEHLDCLSVTKTSENDTKEYYDVVMISFEGIDISKINCYFFGPFNFSVNKNVNGRVTSGSSDRVYVQFSVDKENKE